MSIRLRHLGLAGLLIGVLCVIPSSAQAAVCADFPNQAAAQRAANTRDADGDGIYCESLPCPCLKPGQSGGRPGRSTPTHAPIAKRLPGRWSRRICSQWLRAAA